MNRNYEPSTRQELARAVPDAPPILARLGCGLAVVALLTIVLGALLLLFLLLTGYELLINIQSGGMDGLSAYLEYLTSIDYQHQVNLAVNIAGGVLVAGGLIAFTEAKNFLLWLKR